MRRRLGLIGLLASGFLVATSGAAFACGGLVAPGHAEVLQQATTLSAWHAGFEHYVTGFRFAGSADHFGYIVPLPGVPTSIVKGGGWTLERLEREINPQPNGLLELAAPSPADRGVTVLQQVKIDALNITVVRGGGAAVAAWARKNGFDLTADAPNVLGRYAAQGSVFALARFDRASAAQRGLIEGEGQTIQFTIPMKAPWIPLQILALGKAGVESVNADLFILTDRRPSLSPGIGDLPGVRVAANQEASPSLLRDLGSDQGMGWVPPTGMWFTALRMQTVASAIHRDLSIDGGGPSGIAALGVDVRSATWRPWVPAVVAGMVLATLAMLWGLWRMDLGAARRRT